MISWPPRLRRFDPFKSQFREIEQIDECFNHSNRIVLLDPVVQAFRKQCRLSAIRPLNEALHSIPRDPQWIIHAGRFHTPRVTGGKTRSEYMFSAVPQIAGIARSEFHNSANQPYCRSRVLRIMRSADHAFCGSCVLGPSNSMLGYGVTTPQDYPE